jgi:hypothetical protein
MKTRLKQQRKINKNAIYGCIAGPIQISIRNVLRKKFFKAKTFSSSDSFDLRPLSLNWI